MRERASSSTRLAGGATAITCTAALACAVVIGMGGHIAKMLPERLIFTVIPEDVVAPPPPDSRRFDVAGETRLDTEPPVADIPVFVPEDPPSTAWADPKPLKEPDHGLPATPAPSPRPLGLRTAAKLLPANPPPYPLVDIRRNNEGTSALEVCLNTNGGVTSATLAASSGHDSLDQAALKWVRAAKFAPARVDGVPTAICGHRVSYEWKLDRR